MLHTCASDIVIITITTINNDIVDDYYNDDDTNNKFVATSVPNSFHCSEYSVQRQQSRSVYPFWKKSNKCCANIKARHFNFTYFCVPLAYTKEFPYLYHAYGTAEMTATFSFENKR
jgi:hypothetical protein